ncbi:MAG: hypothetical protein AAB599_01755 [Patescibacteria group bacterium]
MTRKIERNTKKNCLLKIINQYIKKITGRAISLLMSEETHSDFWHHALLQKEVVVARTHTPMVVEEERSQMVEVEVMTHTPMVVAEEVNCHSWKAEYNLREVCDPHHSLTVVCMYRCQVLALYSLTVVYMYLSLNSCSVVCMYRCQVLALYSLTEEYNLLCLCCLEWVEGLFRYIGNCCPSNYNHTLRKRQRDLLAASRRTHHQFPNFQ